MAQIFAGTAIDGSAPIFLTCSWAMYGFVHACSKRLSYHGFATNNLKINRWIFHGTKCCLRFIGVEAKYLNGK